MAITRVRCSACTGFDNEKNPVREPGPEVFGLELPTGDYRVSNADRRRRERALQPGTGSTDLCWAATTRSGHSPRFELVRQALYQQAVSTKEDIQTGQSAPAQRRLSLSPRHDWQALLQVNSMIKGKDSGANAEPDPERIESVF